MRSRSRNTRPATLAAAVAAVLGLLVQGGAASAVTPVSTLCERENAENPPGSCFIRDSHTIARDSVLDFGDRHIVVLATLDLEGGRIAFKGRSIHFGQNGLLRYTNTAENEAVSVSIDVVESVELAGRKDQPLLRLPGCGDSFLFINAGGPVFGTGRIVLAAPFLPTRCRKFGGGGSVMINSGAEVRLPSLIDASGGAEAHGGWILVGADGDVTLGALDVRGGGEGHRGAIGISAGGAVSVGALRGTGTGSSGQGGVAVIRAEGPIEMSTVGLLGSGKNDLDGHGGVLNVRAGDPDDPHDVTIAGTVDVSGRGATGDGGQVSIFGKTVRLKSRLNVESTRVGGHVYLEATETLKVDQAIVGQGRFVRGPLVHLEAGGDLDLLGGLRLGAVQTELVPGGAVLAAGGRLRISSAISAGGFVEPSDSGGAPTTSDRVERCSPSPIPGNVTLAACDIEVTDRANIFTEGSDGSICLEARGRARVDAMMVVALDDGASRDAREVGVYHRVHGERAVDIRRDSVPSYATSHEPALSACEFVGPCNDGGDNDADLAVDFPEDTGCYSALDFTEEGSATEGCELCDGRANVAGFLRVDPSALPLTNPDFTRLDLYLGDGTLVAIDADTNHWGGTYELLEGEDRKYLITWDDETVALLTQRIRGLLEEMFVPLAIRDIELGNRLKLKLNGRRDAARVRGSLKILFSLGTGPVEDAKALFDLKGPYSQELESVEPSP